MKKIYLFLAAALLIGLTASAQKRTETSKEESKVYIKFGRVSKNCTGFGICLFTIELSVDDVISIINALKTENDGLLLTFNDEFLIENKLSKSEGLILDEDFVIDQRTSKTLGYKASKVLKKGKYPITFDAKSQLYNCTLN